MERAMMLISRNTNLKSVAIKAYNIINISLQMCSRRRWIRGKPALIIQIPKCSDLDSDTRLIGQKIT